MPIRGYLGPHGSGKTYAMVRHAYYRRLKHPDMPVWANFKVQLPGDGPVHPLTVWPDDLVRARNGLVLIDEINIVMPSRLWDRVPVQMLYALAMARKFGWEMLWSAQYVARVDKSAREVTSEVWKMMNFRRLGFFAYRSYFGEDFERPFLGGLIFCEPRVDAAYDTLELIEWPEYTERRPGRRGSWG